MLPFERRSNKPPRPGRLRCSCCWPSVARRAAGVAGIGRPLPRVLVPDAGGGARAGGRVERVGDAAPEAVVVEQLPAGRCAAGGPAQKPRSGRRTRRARAGSSRRRRVTGWSVRRCGGRGMRMGERPNEATIWSGLPGPNSRLSASTRATTSKAARPASELASAALRSNRVTVSPANLGGNLYATATCRGLEGSPCAETGNDANGYAAAIYLYGADLVLEQQAGPSVGGVGGELASAATVGGRRADQLHRQRSAVRDLRGRLLGGRPGGAEHRPRRRRGALPERSGRRATAWRRSSYLSPAPGRERRRSPSTPRGSPTAPTSSRSPCSTPRATRPLCSNARSRSTTRSSGRRTGPTPPPRRRCRCGGPQHAQAPARGRLRSRRHDPGTAHDGGRRADRRGQHRRLGAAERDGRAGRRRCRPPGRTPPGASRSPCPAVSPRGRCTSRYRTRLGEEIPAASASLTLVVRAGIALHVSPSGRRASARASTSADACAADRSPPTASSSCSRPAPRAAPGSSSRTSAATAAGASAPATASSSRGRPTTSSGPSPNPSPTTPTAEGASNLVEVFER